MSQIEWKAIEIRASKVGRISHPCPAQVVTASGDAATCVARGGALPAALGWATDAWDGARFAPFRSPAYVQLPGEGNGTACYGHCAGAVDRVAASFADAARAALDGGPLPLLGGGAADEFYLNLQKSTPRFDGERGTWAFASRKEDGAVFGPPLDVVAGDVSPIPGFLPRDGLGAHVWMGNARRRPALTPPHVDSVDSLYVLLRGRKNATLVPPPALARLRTVAPVAGLKADGSPRLAEATRQSEWNHFSRDVGGVAAAADAVNVDLRAGEALFLPSGWAHTFLSEGGHVAVSFTFPPPASARRTTTTKKKKKKKKKKKRRGAEV